MYDIIILLIKDLSDLLSFIFKNKNKKNMENETQEQHGSSLLDALTRPLSEHFGYTLTACLAIYVYATTVMFL